MLFPRRPLPTYRAELSVLLPVLSLAAFLFLILGAYATPNNPSNLTGHSTLPDRKNFTKHRTGEQVYQQLCAACHGPHGEGGKEYKRPLTGDKSVGELARFIHQEMPPDAPHKLPVEDARQVAAYIHDAFYSPLAQARNKPARIELSRLTVRQYRNAISDLMGSFRPGNCLDSRRGLTGQYFKTRQNGAPILERIDPEIRFDFGTKGALSEQDDPYQFAMHWQGSVLAPDTGEYEFIVHTEQAAVLWVNDLQQPLIDAQVKSGNDNEYRASLFLLGGRCYPLRLEFHKGVRGVDDLKKLKEKPPQKASITLAWKQPKRAEEVIPHRCLFPVVAPPVFVLNTPFPPDDRSLGYERGTAVSKEWDEATTEAAMEV
ncbi:MAG: c-type cytochrome, partial [Abitibacteriaceae bacterium]|nr:c-type cytochrome [Abditibacteriaceae bacterium]